MLAEMAEISEPTAAMNWALGGMLLFARAIVGQLLQWMKLPAGRGFSGAGLTSDGNEPQFPRHSRLVTALILLAALTLLFLPIGREATGTVKASWSEFAPLQSDQRELEKIAAKADKEKDARGLAFVALASPDDERAMEFADRAVELDPNLIWIYGTRRHLGENQSESRERMTRLKNSDPDNSFVYLMSARLEGATIFERAIRQGKLGTPGGLINALASDSDWRKEMDQAFLAERYDSYFQRYEESMREGWNKNPSVSSGLIAAGAWRHGFPDYGNIMEYADLQIGQALRVGADGDKKNAEKTLEKIAEQGKKMAAYHATEFERAFGMGLTLRSLTGLQKLYEANGRSHDEKETEAQLRNSSQLRLRGCILMWRGV
jgi:tetratricopeptide (TPR) repeat protein